MGNCLVTKLKESVNNDNLVKMGEYLIKSTYSNEHQYIFNSGWEDTTQRVMYITPRTGNIYIATGSKPGTPSEIGVPVAVYDSTTYVWVEPNASFVVSSYYNGLFRGTIPCDKVQYAVNASIISIIGDISKLNSTSTKIQTVEVGVNGNVLNENTIFQKVSSLSNLQTLDLRTLVNISGTMASIGAALPTSIASISFKTGNTLITGSVEEFVAGQRGKGRTTCEGLSLPNFNLINVTFNGSSVGYTNATLSWTADTITFNGVTINV